MDLIDKNTGVFRPRPEIDRSQFAEWLRVLDFFIPITKHKEGYIRKQLVRTGLAVTFSAATVCPLNEGELVEHNAEYNGIINCSVPDDVSKAFLYTNAYPTDLIIDHPESPYNGRIEMLYYLPQERGIDGFGELNTQIVGACYFLMDGKTHYWADAFHESVAGTREQLSYPEYAPIGIDGVQSDGGYQIILPTPRIDH